MYEVHAAGHFDSARAPRFYGRKIIKDERGAWILFGVLVLPGFLVISSTDVKVGPVKIETYHSYIGAPFSGSRANTQKELGFDEVALSF